MVNSDNREKGEDGGGCFAVPDLSREVVVRAKGLASGAGS